VATLAISWVNAGEWTRPLTAAAIGVAAQATAAYLVSNVGAAAGAEPREAVPGVAEHGAPTGVAHAAA
jgi:hypothetical protein